MASPLPDDVLTCINEALFAGRKIEAIKVYRARTGSGLKEAKEFIDGLEVRLRQTEAGRFASPSAKGCGLTVLSVLIMTGVLWRIGV